MFDSPEWDIEESGEILNSQLFGNEFKNEFHTKVKKKKKKIRGDKNVKKEIILLSEEQQKNIKEFKTKFHTKLKKKKKIRGNKNLKKEIILSPEEKQKNIKEFSVHNNNFKKKTKIKYKQDVPIVSSVVKVNSVKVPFHSTKHDFDQLQNNVMNLTNKQVSVHKKLDELPENEKIAFNNESAKPNRKRKHSRPPNTNKTLNSSGEKKKIQINGLFAQNDQLMSKNSHGEEKYLKKAREIVCKEEDFKYNDSAALQNSEAQSNAFSCKINKLKKVLENSQSRNVSTTVATQPVVKRSKPLSLRESMLQKLKASRFRCLNEQLYTSDGKHAKNYFNSEPDAFFAYHEGYQQQVQRWPINPADIIIKSIKRLPSGLVIADFGCGDAQLARSVQNQVHSFDLVAMSEEVTACDMAHTPLSNANVDIVVFCLSLMGNNLSSFLSEANRVLKEGGLLKIAEVESRFENINLFIQSLQKFGFTNTWNDLSHNLFYFMDFRKQKCISKKMKAKLPEMLPICFLT